MTSGAAASPPQDATAAPPTAPRALVVTYGSVLAPHHGLAVRARTTIDAFARLGVRATVISHSEPDGVPPPGVDELHVLRRPLRLGWSAELARDVRAFEGRADVIVVESALLLPAVRAGRPRVPIVWDTNECETLHYSRLAPTPANRLRGFVWRMIERSSVARADVVVAISATEAEWWRRLFPKSSSKLVIVDHCVPVPRGEPGTARSNLERLCGAPLRRPILLFVGNLLGKHNAAAARWLVDVLAPRLPFDSTLVLAGPGTGELAPSDSQTLLCCLGGVADIDAVTAAADLCLAPLASGAGVKTKVLHYLAHGKPVVATPVALEGIDDAPGVEAAALDDLPALILERVSEPEDAEARRRRQSLQRAWLERSYGRDRIAYQWSAALRLAGVVVS